LLRNQIAAAATLSVLSALKCPRNIRARIQHDFCDLGSITKNKVRWTFHVWSNSSGRQWLTLACLYTTGSASTVSQPEERYDSEFIQRRQTAQPSVNLWSKQPTERWCIERRPKFDPKS